MTKRAGVELELSVDRLRSLVLYPIELPLRGERGDLEAGALPHSDGRSLREVW